MNIARTLAHRLAGEWLQVAGEGVALVAAVQLLTIFTALLFWRPLPQEVGAPAPATAVTQAGKSLVLPLTSTRHKRHEPTLLRPSR